MSRKLSKRLKPTILVVDDTPANLSLLTRILVKEGYKVNAASSGEEAFSYILTGSVDLVLLDVMMPEMDGYQVCQHLKSMELTAHIPVLFISGMDETPSKIKGFEVGGVDYISKPFEPVEVVVRIEHQLRLRKYQRELEEQNAQLQLLLDTTEALSDAVDIESALEGVLAKICQTMDWDFGEAWIPTQGGTQLRLSRGGYSHSPQFEAFRHLSEAIAFTPHEGLPGRVWISKELEWIEDISEATRMISPRMQQAKEVGLKGALAVPICWQREVLAVLMFFSRSPYYPHQRSLTLVQSVANQLASLMRRKQAESDLRQANQELTRLATLDGLTQVANRGHFDQVLHQEWSRLLHQVQPLSMILADVDYFKRYNDCYGHLAGDDCLRQVAQVMVEAVRRSRDLVARYGGEEFVVLLPNTNSLGAFRVAERIHQGIKERQLPHANSDVQPYVTLSLGVACLVPSIALSPESLIATADASLYQAKDQGRDRIVVNEGAG
ncbi:diguanylate cyclase [Roseofilum capinflatum]|uniref:Diguanylate cyclase n=1 Tax=Roseofilum capinflatum BLCC-M114 TaxID=3022440 RepID=A0ABT7BCU4_9CYAN|nr:diguanylate cyclase [Roseofilum capinflatum]MDJ1176986.1 diguanylate cyclase [Roseofilum capinflatum BLCC-M114]